MSQNISEINKFIETYDREAKAIKSELIKVCWYMRGGLSYSEAMCLTQEERSIIFDLIKENIEITKESGLPFF